VTLLSGNSVNLDLPANCTVHDLQEELHYSHRWATLFQKLAVGEVQLEDPTRRLESYLEEGSEELLVTLILSSDDPMKLLESGSKAEQLKAVAALGITYDETSVNKLLALALARSENSDDDSDDDDDDWGMPVADEMLTDAGHHSINKCIASRKPKALAAAKALIANAPFQVNRGGDQLNMAIEVLYPFTYANHPGVREYALETVAELANGNEAGARPLIMQLLIDDLKNLLQGRTMAVPVSGGSTGPVRWTNWRLASKYDLFTRVATQDNAEEAELLEKMLNFVIERPWINMDCPSTSKLPKKQRLSMEGRHVLLGPLLANLVGQGNARLAASEEWTAKLEEASREHIDFLTKVPFYGDSSLPKRSGPRKVLRNQLKFAEVTSGVRSFFVKSMVPDGCTLKQLIPWIMPMLDDPILTSRITAIELLVLLDKDIVEESIDIVAKLKDLWQDGSELWEIALAGLAKLAPDGSKVWSDVAEVYRKSSDRWIQRSTVEFLQHASIPEDLAVEYLAEAALSDVEDIARAAIRTLVARPSCIRGQVLESLVSLTKSDDAFVRKDALSALGKAEARTEGVEALAEAIQKWDQDTYAREAAVTSLTRLSRSNEAAAAALDVCRNCNCLPALKLIEQAANGAGNKRKSTSTGEPIILRPKYAWVSTNAQRIPARNEIH